MPVFLAGLESLDTVTDICGNQLHYGCGDNRRRSDGITIRRMEHCDIDEVNC